MSLAQNDRYFWRKSAIHNSEMYKLLSNKAINVFFNLLGQIDKF